MQYSTGIIVSDSWLGDIVANNSSCQASPAKKISGAQRLFQLLKSRSSYSVQMLSNDSLDPLFEATAQATEEAVVNAMIAAETMTGRDGTTFKAIDHARLQEVLRKYGRLATASAASE